MNKIKRINDPHYKDEPDINGYFQDSSNEGSSYEDSDGESSVLNAATKDKLLNGKVGTGNDKKDKRKGKKKRQREKKKQEKLNSLSSFGDEEGLDLNSAFVVKAASRTKALVGGTNTGQEKDSVMKKKSGGTGSASVPDSVADAGLDPRVMESRQLVVRGNLLAFGGKHHEAIHLFTKAIQCYPNEHRFFGNRSFCYDQIGDFEKALGDAERAIELAPLWPKGYFRKGRALKGVKQFPAAESSFEEVVRLDENCEEARQELLNVRIQQLLEMGFPESKARQALVLHGSVHSALEAFLTSGMVKTTIQDDELNGDEIFFSDTDEEEIVEEEEEEEEGLFASERPQMMWNSAVVQPRPNMPVIVDAKMDPTNPEGLTSLWVGNLLNHIKELELKKLFAKYGEVLSIRLLPEKFCAFVNYRTKVSAGLAMKHLQGYHFGGKDLLIRFPDKPMEKTSAGKALKQTCGPVPVMGDECYFWRTSGCRHGDKCRFRHVSEHRGVDRKPWQKPS